MAASDHLNQHQFGKHRATATKPARVGNKYTEVSADRQMPVNPSYTGRHTANKWNKGK